MHSGAGAEPQPTNDYVHIWAKMSSAPPDPLAALRGPTSKGRGGVGTGKGGVGKGRVRRGKEGMAR